MRQRRMNRMKRQRAIEVGKPVDVSLKPMASNSPQQKELSNLHVRPQVVRKHGIMTPKRVSIMAALGLHLIAVLLATYYVVWPTRLDAEATTVEIVPLVPPHRVRQPIRDLGGDNYPRDGCLTPNPSPWELDDRDRSFGPTPPDAFVTLEVTRRSTWLKKIEPKYPSEAKRAGKEGKVVLEATIDVEGKAKDIKIKEDKVGFGCAEAAVEALKASRFTPAKRGVESVPFRIAIPYQFKLEDSSDPSEQAECSIPSPDPIHCDAPSSLEITRPPAFRTKIEPKYPRAARLAQKEGRVVLEATIDVDGKAKDIKIKEDKVGFGCAEAAIEALKASRFIPATRGDERVPIRIVIPYQFKLKEKVTRVNRQQTRLNQEPPRTPVEGNRAKKVEDGCW